jgi:hypothetical protein
MLKLYIETTNEAFADAPATELARILRELAEFIEHEGPPGWAPLLDADGNDAGEVEFSAPDRGETA